MDVENLSKYLPINFINLLKEKGIRCLYPPQEKAVKKGLFSRRNMVIAIPTASGKTLIAELAMLYEITNGGKCLYTVPLKALANEKYKEFKKWEDLGVKVAISTGDFESRDEWLGKSDIIITTSEKADSLMRNKASWMKKVSLLVIDEIHLIDSVKRGAVVEILVAKLRRLNPMLRIIALSATIPNADEIADWLDAEIVHDDWRPIPLYESVFYPGKILRIVDGKIREINSKNSVDELVRETLDEGGQVLIFESTRRNAESQAERLIPVVESYADDNEAIAEEILIENEGEMSQKLARCVKHGIAFHHAGLLSYQRELIEDAFRIGKIKVVTATPTLAAGVNLPARRVIVKGIRRYYSGFGNIYIKVREYKQMAGRAGRPNFDDYGEAIIVSKSKSEALEILERFVMGEAEKIESKLGIESHLRFHILSIIAEDIANSMDDIIDFFSSTFFAYQNEFAEWEINRVVLQLMKWGFVEGAEVFVASEIGKLISKLYIDPLSGFIFKESAKRFDNLSDIALLHLICRTPDMELLYIRRSDEWVEELAYEFKDELTHFPSYYSAEYDLFLKEFKTALCLNDWINEKDEDVICSKYGIAPGDLRRIVETAEWLVHSLTKVLEFYGNELAIKCRKLEKRIKYGVNEELVDLVSIKWIGRRRARKLFNAGIKNYEGIIEKRELAEKIIGKRIVEKILREERWVV